MAQQSLVAPLLGQGPAGMASFLAAERIRAAYQLCRSVREDVCREDIEHQKGHLAELYAMAKSLVDELEERL